MSKKEKIFWFLLTLLVFIGLFGGFSWKDKIKTQKEIQKKKEIEKIKEYISKKDDLILEKEKRYPIQSRDHIKPGQKIEKYSTNPPTSGPHENAERGGFYKNGLADEKGVHNLEHGYIWITYKNISDEEVKDLEKISKEYLGSVIISKRDKNDFNGIALASWGNLMKIKSFDEIIIKDFIKRNKNNSPEKLAR